MADRLGKLAMDLQQKEEEEEKSRDAAEKLDEEESQDMFAPTPFLASRETPKMHLLPSQSKEKARNPFAKRTESTSSPG